MVGAFVVCRLAWLKSFERACFKFRLFFSSSWVVGIHLRLFHNWSKVLGVYNGLFDIPTPPPPPWRVQTGKNHLLLKLLGIWCLGLVLDHQRGLSFCGTSLCWDSSILNIFFWFRTVLFKMYSMMMCPQEKEKFRTSLVFFPQVFVGGILCWLIIEFYHYSLSGTPWGSYCSHPTCEWSVKNSGKGEGPSL